MKALFLALTLMVTPAFGFEVPKDAVIKVYDKSGKQIGEMKRSEYKVVKLGTSKVKIVEKRVEVPVQKIRKVKHHKSVIVHAGAGPNGLRARNNGEEFVVRERQRPVGGLTGCVSENGTGICASAFTNETLTLGIKFDFD